MRRTVAVTSLLFLALSLALAFSVPALRGQDIGEMGDLFEGLEAVPRSGFPADVAPTAIAREGQAPGHDLFLSISDKTFNSVLQAIQKRPKKDRDDPQVSPSGKRLESLWVSFPRGNYMALTGTYAQEATTDTKAATFKFNVVARLGTPEVNIVQMDIVGAQIYLNDAKVFESTPRDTRPIGAVLDFLSPGITRRAQKGIEEARTSLQRRYGDDAVNPDVDVTDLFSIDGNVFRVRILPGLLSPLFPPIQLTEVKIREQRLEMKANFQ